jgi:hypothetical protein
VLQSPSFTGQLTLDLNYFVVVMLMEHLDSYNGYDIMEVANDHWLSLIAQTYACCIIGANVSDRLIMINLI